MVNKAENILNHAVGILMITVTIIMFVQVISRYLFNFPLTWSEELGRYLIIWMVFLGMPLGVKRSTHLKVELNLLEKVPWKTKFIVEMLLNLIIVVLWFILIIYGYKYAILFSGSTAMTLPISKFYIFVTVPVSGIFTLLFVTEKIWISIFKFKNKK